MAERAGSDWSVRQASIGSVWTMPEMQSLCLRRMEREDGNVYEVSDSNTDLEFSFRPTFSGGWAPVSRRAETGKRAPRTPRTDPRFHPLLCSVCGQVRLGDAMTVEGKKEKHVCIPCGLREMDRRKEIRECGQNASETGQNRP